MQKLFTLVLSYIILTSSINAQPSEGLVAYYPFNGNTNDESGNGLDGTIHNVTLTEDRFGENGKAYSFLGDVTSYIQTDASSILNLSGDATLAAWIKGTGTLNDIVRTIGTTDDGIEINTWSNGTANSNYSYSGNNWFNIYSNSLINDNQWHFIVVTVTSNQGKLFVDGSVVTDTTSNGPFSMTSPAYLSIGRHPLWTERAFNGSIDDIRIYNRALSEQEIAALYHENGWPLNNGLVAYYPFNGNANDESMNGHNGSLTDVILVKDRFGNDNSAYEFNGNSSNIIIPASPQLIPTNITVSAWCYYTSYPMNGGWICDIIGNGSVDVGQAWELNVRAQAPNYYTQGVDFVYQSGSARADAHDDAIPPNKLGEWIHIVGVYDNENGRIAVYRNGILSGEQLGVYAGQMINTNDLMIGNYFETGGNRKAFPGMIDDIRIYNRALSETEVSDLYHENGWTGRELNTIIITHGFTADWNPAPWPIENSRWEHFRWQFAMADAVSNNRDIYLIRKGEVIPLSANFQNYEGIDSLTSIEEVINTFRVSRAINSTKDNIFIFDWTLESAVNKHGYAEAAGDILAAALIKVGIDYPLVLKNLHFIGHSRGCVVNSETIQRLIYWADNGKIPSDIIIDPEIHMTTLDPHPAGHWTKWYPYSNIAVAINDDNVNSSNIKLGISRIGVVGWKGSLSKTKFIDNYWEHRLFSPLWGLSNYPGLNSTNVSSNLDLTSFLPNNSDAHSLVHTWYFGTVDTLAVADEFNHGPLIERNNWYNPNNEATQGFYYSRNRNGDLNSIISVNEDLITITSDQKYTEKDFIFNGSFTKGDNALFELDSLPGWSYQDGRTSKRGGLFNPAALIDDDHQTLIHNLFYVPIGATRIFLRMRTLDPLQQYASPDELEVYINNTFVKSFQINSFKLNYKKEVFSIPNEYIGKTVSLMFKLKKNQSNYSSVLVDDISLWQITKIRSTAACPVDFNIYDNLGNHTGPINDSTFVEEIPGSEYYVYEDSTGDKIKTVYLEPLEGNANYIFRIQSRDTTSSFNYEIEDYSDTTRGTISYLFEEVAIEPNTVAACTLFVSTQVPSLEVDLNGDGITDTIYVPAIITAVENEENSAIQLPTQYTLNQNYPNPFNPLTNITYSLPERNLVTIKVFDILGKEIASLVNEEKERGNYSVRFTSSGLASGIYFYQLKAGDFISTKKMILLK